MPNACTTTPFVTGHGKLPLFPKKSFDNLAASGVAFKISLVVELLVIAFLGAVTFLLFGLDGVTPAAAAAAAAALAAASALLLCSSISLRIAALISWFV